MPFFSLSRGSRLNAIYDASVMGPAATVVFADDRIVVVDKPPGLSLATRHAEPTAAVGRVLAALPASDVHELGLGPESAWLVHRLDVGTSGLVLLARSREAHRSLTQCFAQRRVGKLYLALVWGHPRPAAAAWTAPLGPDLGDRRKMAVVASGRSATSEYRIAAAVPHLSLVALHPLTGRTHQLRVHAAHAGHPIVGDDFYGGPRHRGLKNHRLRALLQPGRPLLHAWRLVLPADREHLELRLETSLPADFETIVSALGIDFATAAAGILWPEADPSQIWRGRS